MALVLDSAALVAKLATLNTSAESIQTLSGFVLFFKRSAKEVSARATEVGDSAVARGWAWHGARLVWDGCAARSLARLARAKSQRSANELRMSKPCHYAPPDASAPQVATTWASELSKAPPQRKLAFVFLANGTRQPRCPVQALTCPPQTWCRSAEAAARPSSPKPSPACSPVPSATPPNTADRTRHAICAGWWLCGRSGARLAQGAPSRS